MCLYVSMYIYRQIHMYACVPGSTRVNIVDNKALDEDKAYS